MVKIHLTIPGRQEEEGGLLRARLKVSYSVSDVLHVRQEWLNKRGREREREREYQNVIVTSFSPFSWHEFSVCRVLQQGRVN